MAPHSGERRSRGRWGPEQVTTAQDRVSDSMNFFFQVPVVLFKCCGNKRYGVLLSLKVFGQWPVAYKAFAGEELRPAHVCVSSTKPLCIWPGCVI